MSTIWTATLAQVGIGPRNYKKGDGMVPQYQT